MVSKTIAGSGALSSIPQRRVRMLMLLQGLWASLILALAGWWGYLVLKQASTILELEKRVGAMAAGSADVQFFRTQRMLVWESGTLFVLLVASVGLYHGLYWRDRRRSQAVQSFFASMSHELRTPLSSIRLQAEAIQENASKDGASRDAFALARRLIEDTVRLEAQVERTLELARVEGGGVVYSGPVPIRAVVDRLMRSLKQSFEGTLQVESRLPDAEIQGDISALHVILKNLVDNSLRHSKREPVQVTLSGAATDDGHFVLIYRDNGVGYRGDPSQLGRLFYKGPSSGGTGVGLYLVRTLMQRMGGGVRFGAQIPDGGTATAGSGFVAELTFKISRDEEQEGEARHG